MGILLAHGLVGLDGDFTIAWGGDQGDDAAALEEVEDALARPGHESLDLLLRGRGVEHLALALAGAVHDFESVAVVANSAKWNRGIPMVEIDQGSSMNRSIVPNGN